MSIHFFKRLAWIRSHRTNKLHNLFSKQGRFFWAFVSQIKASTNDLVQNKLSCSYEIYKTTTPASIVRTKRDNSITLCKLETVSLYYIQSFLYLSQYKPYTYNNFDNSEFGSVKYVPWEQASHFTKQSLNRKNGTGLYQWSHRKKVSFHSIGYGYSWVFTFNQSVCLIW